MFPSVLILLMLYCFLFLADVHCLGNHPISRVEIMGYIVSVDIKEKLATYGGTEKEFC